MAAVVAADVAVAAITFGAAADAAADDVHTADVANFAELLAHPEQFAVHYAPDHDDDADDDLESPPVVFAFAPPHLPQRSLIHVYLFPSFPIRVSSLFQGPSWQPCSHW